MSLSPSPITNRRQTTFPSPESVERIPWGEFLDEFDWAQGDHVTILGTTGGGKTTVMRAILPRRDYQVIFASKPRDPVVEGARRSGYSIIRTWPPHPHVRRCVFWPKIEKMSDANDQRMKFYGALYDIYRQGGWCVAFDEAAYLARTLNLGHVLKFYYEQARSLNISLVTLSQRPKEIPLLAYSCATHLFLFRETDAVNLKRLQEISGVDAQRVKAVVPRLNFLKHEFLYVNARTGDLKISRVERG